MSRARYLNFVCLELNAQSLEATRRMVALAENTRAVGAKTLENLDHQGGAYRFIGKSTNGF
jgi:hypothetical protein